MADHQETIDAQHTALPSRRQLFKAGGALSLGLAAADLLAEPAPASSTGDAPADPSLVRLASVLTAQDGGLLPELVAQFEAEAPYRVSVSVGDDVYVQARAGKADVCFSHWGHKDVEAFITDGQGQWPRAVLFNSIALIVPSGDPAGVGSLTDPLAAFEHIAATRSPFVVNALPELQYLADTLWNGSGRPDKTGWYLDQGFQKDAAMQAAAAQGAYTLWGITPFLVAQRKNQWPLRPVLYGEELFHRMMVTIVVNPARFPRANVAGARAFQTYLLLPATQARILNYRLPGFPQPLFWPAGRNNAPALLPGGGPQRSVAQVPQAS